MCKNNLKRPLFHAVVIWYSIVSQIHYRALSTVEDCFDYVQHSLALRRFSYKPFDKKIKCFHLSNFALYKNINDDE